MLTVTKVMFEIVMHAGKSVWYLVINISIYIKKKKKKEVEIQQWQSENKQTIKENYH